MKFKIVVATLLIISACTNNSEKGKKENTPPRLTYVLDMVFNNPGEAPTVTKYKDPVFLKKTGFNGMVPAWHIQCGLTYDSFEKGIIPEGSKEREWILKKQRWVKEKLQEAENAGMPVYAFTDMLVLPAIILEKYKDQIVTQKENHVKVRSIHGKLKPDINKPLTQKILRAQIKELFETFPLLDGLVIRFGETYLFDTKARINET